MHKVSCVIAAYNEAPRIGGVLRAVTGHPLLNEIIVVDDGSKDNTAGAARTFKNVRLISHDKNQGKSKAVHTGLTQAKGDVIFLLDADLVGLTAENITDILNPVLNNLADVGISMRRNSPWIDRILGIDYISGERVFSKALIEKHLDEIYKLPNFGLEVFLNRIIIKNKCRIKVAYWENVISPLKSKKIGLISGIKSDIRMISDILKVISIFEVIYQFTQMLRLKVD